MFRQLGRAALGPVYARAHGLAEHDKAHQLNGPPGSALLAVKVLIEEVQPRKIPKNPDTKSVVLYTDACFVLDGEIKSPRDENPPMTWNKAKCCHCENGWGYVIHRQG